MKRTLFGVVILSIVGAVAFGGTISISGTDNIFQAGLGTSGTSAGSGNGGQGTFPGAIDVTGATSITFTSITGTTNDCGGNAICTAGAGGIADIYPGGGTSFASQGSLSGIVDAGQIWFLTGVFEIGGGPSGTAPCTIGAGGCSNTNTTPALDQLFVIGSGGVSINVPNGATSLFLGLADGTPFVTGTPGAYSDNTGSLSADYSISAAVPEPASFGLIGLGLVSIGLLRKRLSR